MLLTHKCVCRLENGYQSLSRVSCFSCLQNVNIRDTKTLLMLLPLVTDMLSHSDAVNRTRSSIGFYISRSRWGGYSRSERMIKVSNGALNAALTRTISIDLYVNVFCAAVLYEICRPDSKTLTVMLPVNTTAQDVISAVVKPGGDHVLVKMNSAGGLHVVTMARAVPPRSVSPA